MLKLALTPGAAVRKVSRTWRHPNEGKFVERFARLVGIALVALSLTAGAVALAGNGGAPSSGGPGNSGAVKPGKGCGDKNHYHQREDECKNPPK
jgi:hypothetical protein